MARKYDYYVWTGGMKEYRIQFETVNDAEYAYDKACSWRDMYLGIYEPWLGDEEIYIVCRNETLHKFVEELEAELGLVNGEIE